MRSTILLLVLGLQGCAVIAAYPITTASLAIWGTTGKGPTDHAVSFMTERDCSSIRIINGDSICRELPPLQYAEVVDSQGRKQ